MAVFSVFFGQLGLLIVLMSVLAVPGTLIVKRLLRHISTEQFQQLYRAAFVLAGGKVLLYEGVYRSLGK